MSLSLTNASATFQRFMYAVFAAIKWRNLLVYIDDLYAYFQLFLKIIELI